jgi:hypothetical protein
MPRSVSAIRFKPALIFPSSLCGIRIRPCNSLEEDIRLGTEAEAFLDRNNDPNLHPSQEITSKKTSGSSKTSGSYTLTFLFAHSARGRVIYSSRIHKNPFVFWGLPIRETPNRYRSYFFYKSELQYYLVNTE